MAEPTVNNFDTFLNLWAVLGPLLVAVANAMWSRHIQTSDRKYELSREQANRLRSSVKIIFPLHGPDCNHFVTVRALPQPL